MRKLLIESLAEFGTHISIAESFDFNEFRPALAMAQDQCIETELMGKDLLSYFLEIQDGGEGDEIDADIITHASAAIANLALLNSIGILNLNITSGGFTVNQSEGKAVASMNRIEALKDQLNFNYQYNYSKLVSLLVEHTNLFDGYIDTPQRKAIKGGFVNTPEEFNTGLLGVSINWFVLTRMRNHLRTIESIYLIKVLGADLFAFMREKILKNESLGDYAPILPFIQKAVSSQTFTDTCANLGVRIDERGIYLEFIRNANDPNQTQALSSKGEGILALSHKKKAEEDWNVLANHLIENADNYTMYKNSSAYTDRTITPEPIKPSGNAVFFGL